MHDPKPESVQLPPDDSPPFAPGYTLTLQRIADDLAVALQAVDSSPGVVAAILAAAIGNVRDVADDVFVTAMDASDECGLRATLFAVDGLLVEAQEMRRHAASMRQLARRGTVTGTIPGEVAA